MSKPLFPTPETHATRVFACRQWPYPRPKVEVTIIYRAIPHLVRESARLVTNCCPTNLLPTSYSTNSQLSILHHISRSDTHR